MAEHWFRSYHGAPLDAKWILIAQKAGVQPGMVASLWWALLDHASQAKPRGSVADFDVEAVAAFYGYDVTHCNAVLVTLRERGMIRADGVLRTWSKRNPKREDDSAERVRKHRESKRLEDGTKSVTHRNAVQRDVTLEEMRVEEMRVEEIKNRVAASPEAAQARPAAAATLDDDREDQISAVIRAANRGMIENPNLPDSTPPILTSHGRSRQQVADWLDAGIPPAVLLSVIEARAQQFKPDRPGGRISTLGYFDAAVREAHETGQSSAWKPPADSEAGRVRNEQPKQNGARGNGMVRVDGHDPEAEKRKQESADIERADAWRRAHPDEAQVLAADVVEEVRLNPKLRGLTPGILEQIALGEVRRRVLTKLQPASVA